MSADWPSTVRYDEVLDAGCTEPGCCLLKDHGGDHQPTTVHGGRVTCVLSRCALPLNHPGAHYPPRDALKHVALQTAIVVSAGVLDDEQCYQLAVKSRCLVIVLPEGESIETLSEADMRRAGWVRARQRCDCVMGDRPPAVSPMSHHPRCAYRKSYEAWRASDPSDEEPRRVTGSLDRER